MAPTAPPRLRVPRLAAAPFDADGKARPLADWKDAADLGPFLPSHGRGEPTQPTQALVAHDDRALYVRFTCVDRDPWGTHRDRDAPLHEEEVVEVFVAAGPDDPVRYLEFQVSPLGVLYDAVVENPHGRRSDMRVDPAWQCEGIAWSAAISEGGWWAALSLPWASLLRGAPRPVVWRANFYRIDRPRDGSPEYSAWSPTLVEPADFHVPSRFGTLELDHRGAELVVR